MNPWSPRRLAAAMPILAAFALVGTACDSASNGGPPPSTPVSANAWPAGFGQADSKAGAECTFDATPATKCLGYSPLDFTDKNNAERLADWLEPIGKDKKNWNDLNDHAGQAKEVDRVLDDESIGAAKRPKFGISSIVDARKIPLAKFPTGAGGGLVIGRFTVKKDQELDLRYGISGVRTKEMDIRDFYIVIDQWNPVANPKNKQFQFAVWRVYGIQKKGSSPARLVRVSSSAGAFNWCEMTHDAADQQNGARFITCEGATVVKTVSNDTAVLRVLSARSLVQGTSLLDALEFELRQPAMLPYSLNPERVSAALKSIFAMLPKDGPSSFEKVFPQQTIVVLSGALDLAENPGWLACGIGCCSADW